MTWVAKPVDTGYLYPMTSFVNPGALDEVHVYPEEDLCLHILVGMTCVCNPIRTEAGVISHNSWDNREFWEEKGVEC